MYFGCFFFSVLLFYLDCLLLDITDNLGKEQFIIIEEIKKLRNRTIFEILKRAKSFPYNLYDGHMGQK